MIERVTHTRERYWKDDELVTQEDTKGEEIQRETNLIRSTRQTRGDTLFITT